MSKSTENFRQGGGCTRQSPSTTVRQLACLERHQYDVILITGTDAKVREYGTGLCVTVIRELQLGIPRRRWGDNIKLDLQEV